jgi:uncharacterized protein (TIGR02271 family)
MTGERSDYSGREIVDVLDETYELHDADGDKVGDIAEVNPEFLVVRMDGGLFGSDRTIFVPRGQIAREDGSDWYLGIDKDELESMGWDTPQGSYQTTTADVDATQTIQETGTDYDAATTGTAATGTRLRRYEEELQAQTTSREAGEVSITKDVVEEVQTIEVPVTREEVRIERRPVSGEATTGEVGSDAFASDSIRVPVMAEEVEVRKVARPVEEIEIEKVQVQDTERVQETVRKETFDVDGDDAASSMDVAQGSRLGGSTS